MTKVWLPQDASETIQNTHSFSNKMLEQNLLFTKKNILFENLLIAHYCNVDDNWVEMLQVDIVECPKDLW